MPRAYIVAGLAFGDEGKGATTDALVRKTGATLVVRYNGGAQCAHNVISPEGTHHCFAQFGSGSFLPNVKTYLSRFVLINPVRILAEAQELIGCGVTDAATRMMVDRHAVVITPFQRALNRLKELSRGDKRHGSTGMGIGQTREDHLKYGNDMLLAGDLSKPNICRDKLELIRSLCLDRALHLENIDWDNDPAKTEFMTIHRMNTIEKYLDYYKDFTNQIEVVSDAPFAQTMVFEGAQGLLLDEEFGFQPHTTWTDITFRNAKVILDEMGFVGSGCSVHTVGVVRSYYTRHGAGPFPSEDASLVGQLPEEHNKAEAYTGNFRVGNFDLAMFLYAIECLGGVDSLAINHMDVASSIGAIKMRIARSCHAIVNSKNLIPMLSESVNTPVSIIGYGPRADQRTVNIR